MEEIDFKKSNLPVEGTEQEIQEWGNLVASRQEVLQKDQMDRRAIYRKRYDFYVGDHSSYTTVVGRVSKEKKGHANATYNYAGKTAVKIVYGLANNPPKITQPARSLVPEKYLPVERVRAQAVEAFVDEVFARNHFWKRHYRRGCFNQVVLGDAAIKVYPVNVGTKESPEWEIRIVNHEKMDNVMFGWRSDDSEDFDYTLAEADVSIQSLRQQYGIEVPLELQDVKKQENQGNSSSPWDRGNLWDTKSGGAVSLATGRNSIPTIKLVEYDDENSYGWMVGGKVAMRALKDDAGFPKLGFWVRIPNIPVPGSPWSMSDIDAMIDPQVEFNEASNEERDYIRVGSKARFVAFNMQDFDPESVKTESGGVIFVDSPMGDADFRALQTNVNVFPSQTFLQRTRDVMYDLGIPKVTFGASGADSGRSKAIDYQSMIDLVVFKRDAWELGLDQIIEKIQRLAWFYFPEMREIFSDPVTGEFVVRHPEFDWTDIFPITQSDRVVNVLNKFTMGLPFRYVFKELGYRDVDAVIQAIKEESQDPVLMEFRAKMYQLTGGIMAAQQRAAQLSADMEQIPPTAGAPGAPDVNSPSPVLTPSQNEGAPRLPVAQRGGTTAFSSAAGLLSKTRQNMTAMGR